MSDDGHEAGIEAVAKALIDEGCGSGWAYPRAHKVIAAYEQAAGLVDRESLVAGLAAKTRECEHMYQRALDAESHAAFGPMDVDERVRMLRAALDNEEDARKAAEASAESLVAEIVALARTRPDARAEELAFFIEREFSARPARTPEPSRTENG